MKDQTDNRVKYPRRVFIRSAMRTLGKVLLALFARVEINGRVRLPKKGPMILAGNHAAVLEAVMMAVYNPGLVEFIGNGDIPFDPNYAFIVNAYDLIPVNRGNLDRKGLQKAASVLEQDGILGIFPEGGVWQAGQMPAQIGAAWLSYRTQAPVLPIGFGGIRGGLGQALKLKRPKLVMNVGEVLPPVTLDENKTSMKASLAKSADLILEKINALVPQEDLRQARMKVDQRYILEVEVHQGRLFTSSPPPEGLQVTHGDAYAHFLYNPTMIDVLVRNLRLPLHPLMQIDHEYQLDAVIAAWDAILAYLKDNPGFFTYRFGVDEGLAVEQALQELRRLAVWAQENQTALSLTPIHTYRNANTSAQVTEKGGSFPSNMPMPVKGIKFQ